MFAEHQLTLIDKLHQKEKEDNTSDEQSLFIFSLPNGCGKTRILFGLQIKNRLKTLIVVHKTILSQWYKELRIVKERFSLSLDSIVLCEHTIYSNMQNKFHYKS